MSEYEDFPELSDHPEFVEASVNELLPVTGRTVIRLLSATVSLVQTGYERVTAGEPVPPYFLDDRGIAYTFGLHSPTSTGMIASIRTCLEEEIHKDWPQALIYNIHRLPGQPILERLVITPMYDALEQLMQVDDDDERTDAAFDLIGTLEEDRESARSLGLLVVSEARGQILARTVEEFRDQVGDY